MNNSILELMNLETGMVLKAEIENDCFNSPREWDNLGTMLTWQSDHISPDENEFSSPAEFFSSIVGDTIENRIFENNDNNMEYFNEIKQHMNKQGYIVFPVYCYEHGVIVYSTGSFSCPWDSGMVGVIYATKEKIYEEFGIKRINSKVREVVENNFKSECETYTHWVNGDVYGFVLEDLQGNHIDSCWGFYDDFNDKETLLEVVSTYANIGNIDDWREYDELVIAEI